MGDAFPLAPGVGLRVARVEPGQVLVVTSEGGTAPSDVGFDFTWAFVLGEDTGGGTTRLHVRERYRTSSHKVRLTTQVTSVVSAVMSARMMRTIRRLAEETSPEPGPAA